MHAASMRRRAKEKKRHFPKPSPLHVELANRISAQIQNGEFPAEMHLSETSLSARFEVSRTPIRAALKILAKHKLVSRRDPSGFVVSADATKSKVPRFASTVSTTQELYRTLVDARARRLLPELLTESELLARFPVPRSVMLKTLAHLASGGLMEKRRGHGWRFLPSLGTREGIIESYNFRLAIEPNGFLQPTFKYDKDELQRCRVAHERFLQLSTANQKVSEFRELNSTFHEMLARFSGNRFFLQVVQQQNQLRRLEEHADFFRHLRTRESCQEHLSIISAVEAGDLDWAASLMRRHLSVARDVS